MVGEVSLQLYKTIFVKSIFQSLLLLLHTVHMWKKLGRSEPSIAPTAPSFILYISLRLVRSAG